LKIDVRTFGELMEVLGKHFLIELEDGEDLNHLIDRLERRAKTGKTLPPRLLREPTLTILINGHNIQTLKGFKTPLKDGDVVTFMPLVVGG